MIPSKKSFIWHATSSPHTSNRFGENSHAGGGIVSLSEPVVCCFESHHIPNIITDTSIRDFILALNSANCSWHTHVGEVHHSVISFTHLHTVGLQLQFTCCDYRSISRSCAGHCMMAAAHLVNKEVGVTTLQQSSCPYQGRADEAKDPDLQITNGNS